VENFSQGTTTQQAITTLQAVPTRKVLHNEQATSILTQQPQ